MNPREAAAKLVGFFPQITRRDLAVKLPRGQNRWVNRVEWTKQRLLDKKEVESPFRGVWKITPKGMTRLKIQGKNSLPQPSVQRTIHDRVVKTLFRLANQHASYKEVYADNIGVTFKPLFVTSPPAKGVHPDVQPYNPDVWAKLRNNTIDVYEVWDSQGERERRSDCVEDILLPALTENIGTLSIVCFDQQTAEFARKLTRIILPQVADGQGTPKLDTSNVLQYVVVIPQNIQGSESKMAQFLSQKLNLP